MTTNEIRALLSSDTSEGEKWAAVENHIQQQIAASVAAAEDDLKQSIAELTAQRDALAARLAALDPEEKRAKLYAMKEQIANQAVDAAAKLDKELDQL